MRAVREAAWMNAQHSRVDVIAAEKLACMVEDDFVKVVI